MTADEARKLATKNKERMKKAFDIEKRDAFQGDVESLVNHFKAQINDAVERGSLKTKEISFPSDRFSDEVISEVNNLLKKDGFNLTMVKNHAFNKTAFSITW